MNRIEAAIRAANTEGRPALAPFLTAGYPDRAGFAHLATRVAAAADLIELGVPFSDPMADGVTIQRTSRAALAAGTTLEWILKEIAPELTASAPIVLMSYLNPIVALGVERFAERAAGAAIAGVIVPDLPFEECAPLRDPLDAAGIALIQLVTRSTSVARQERLCHESRGFVYAVTRHGTTGANGDASNDPTMFLEALRAISPLPVLAGFGVRDAATFKSVTAHADGAIVGSALLEAIERGDDPVRFLHEITGGKAS